MNYYQKYCLVLLECKDEMTSRSILEKAIRTTIMERLVVNYLATLM